MGRKRVYYEVVKHVSALDKRLKKEKDTIAKDCTFTEE